MLDEDPAKREAWSADYWYLNTTYMKHKEAKEKTKITKCSHELERNIK